MGYPSKKPSELTLEGFFEYDQLLSEELLKALPGLPIIFYSSIVSEHFLHPAARPTEP